MIRHKTFGACKVVAVAAATALFGIGAPVFALNTKMSQHPASAQMAPHTMQPQHMIRPRMHRTMVSAADRQFVISAARGGMAEVAFGKLAQQRGSSPAVKQFGARMVTDHSNADARLRQVAAGEGIILPSSLSRQDQANLRRLSRLSGTAFDRTYGNMMVRDHVTDIAEFQREAAKGKDQHIRQFASSTLPTLRMHLQMARSMETSGRSRMMGSAR